MYIEYTSNTIETGGGGGGLVDVFIAIHRKTYKITKFNHFCLRDKIAALSNNRAPACALKIYNASTCAVDVFCFYRGIRNKRHKK